MALSPSRSSPSYSCKGGLLRKTPTSHGRHFIFYTRQTYVRNMCFIVGCRKLVPRECLHGVFDPPLLPSIRENSASQIIQVRLADITKGFPPFELPPSYSCKGGLLRKTPTSHGRHFIFYTRQTYVRSMCFIVGCRKLVPRECLHGVFDPPLLPSIRENSASQIIQVRLAGYYPLKHTGGEHERGYPSRRSVRASPHRGMRRAYLLQKSTCLDKSPPFLTFRVWLCVFYSLHFFS